MVALCYGNFSRNMRTITIVLQFKPDIVQLIKYFVIENIKAINRYFLAPFLKNVTIDHFSDEILQ